MGRPGTKMTNQDWLDFIDKLYSGQSFRSLMKEYYVGFDRARREVEKRGVVFYPGQSRTFPEEAVQKAIDNYLFKKQGLATCGKEFGISQSCMEFILKSRGIKKRTYVESKQEIRKYSCDDDFFKKPSRNMGYMLGFIAADGSVSQKENGIHINLNQIDSEILERMRIATKSSRPIKYYTKKQTGQKLCKMSVWSHEWKHDLAAYGIVPKKTFILKPPYLLDKKFYSDYIRGYFDADGCVFARHNKKRYDVPEIEISGANKETMNWIYEILSNQFGIHCFLRTKNRVDYATFYKVDIYQKQAVKRFYYVLYHNSPELFLQRKKSKFDSLLQIPRDHNLSDEEIKDMLNLNEYEIQEL